MRRQVSNPSNLSLGDRLIYVVGCNHGIQPVDADPFDGEQVLAQRAHFRELIAELIRGNNIQFVGEEWGREDRTIAHILAEEIGNIPWSNINTSHKDLDAMKIPHNYGNEAHSPEQIEKWHRQREGVMREKIVKTKGDAERIVVICGFLHLQPLTELLQKTFKSVEPIDYRLLDWYANVFVE